MNLERAVPLDRVGEVNRLMDTPRPVVAAATDYPAGHSTDWHTHPRGQLIYAIQGVMGVHADDGVRLVPPERAVWMPAGVRHRVECRNDVRMRSVFPDDASGAALPETCTVVTVSPLLRELIQAAMDVPTDYDLTGADGRLMAVLLDQLRRLPETPLFLPLPQDTRLKRVTEAIMNDPARPETLDEWAASVGAGARTLARLFQKQTGLSFGAWRQQARLLAALELLAGGAPVTATALDMGYGSPSAFTAMFKRAFGVSPRGYFKGRVGGQSRS